MSANTYSFRIAKTKFDSYSKKGKTIHLLYMLIPHVIKQKITIDDIINKSIELNASSKLKSVIVALRNSSEISSAKKSEPIINEKRVDEILDCFLKLLKLSGFEFEGYTKEDVGKSYNLEITFRKLRRRVINWKRRRKIKASALKNNGLLNIIEKNPLENEDFKESLSEANELRILESSVHNWRDWEKVISKALKGKLRKVKLLICQPYSMMAKERSHIYGSRNAGQFENMNDDLKKILQSFQSLQKEYQDDDNYSLEMRAYYRANSFPIYQCCDKKGNNIISFMGIFWQHLPSTNQPHFQIHGQVGSLINRVNEHFNHIWTYPNLDEKEIEEEKNKDFNWYQHIGKMPTIDIDKERDISDLIDDLENAYEQRGFSNYKISKPSWLSFNCFYYNFNGERSNFVLEVDRKMGIARIKSSPWKNKYYGVAIRLHSSYLLLLHTVNKDTQKRLITLNIYVGGDDLDKENSFLAIYSNNDRGTGIPYSQIMKIIRKDKGQDTGFDFDEFKSTFGKKRIELGDLRKSQNDIIYNFRHGERNSFYQKLVEELRKAENEIYFLGYGPIHFPDAGDNFMQRYYELHKALIKKPVKINRILLDKDLNENFVRSMIDIKSDKELKDRYELYVSPKKIPTITDVALIDPKEENATAIITYFENDLKSETKSPIRMEVVKNNSKIISNLRNTFLEYKTSGLVKKLETIREIKKEFGLK